MTWKITTRLTLWYAGVFGITVILIAVARYTIFASGEMREMDRTVREYAEYLEQTPVGAEGVAADQYAVLDSMNAASNLHFRSLWFFVHNGTEVLYDNSVRNIVPRILDSILREVREDEQEVQTVTLNSGDYRIYSAPTPWKTPTSDSLTLCIVMPLKGLDASLARLRTMLIWSIVIFLAVAWFGGAMLARYSLRPIETLRQTADGITATNLAERVPIRRVRDELSLLSETFNNMIARLERAVGLHRQFVSDISHDLRTPLTTIRVELEMWLGNPNAPPGFRDAVLLCLRQIDRLNHLTSDLMIMATVDTDGLSPALQPVQIDELLLEIVSDLHAPLAEKRIDVELSLPDGEGAPDTVRGDPFLIRRAVENVIDNAMQYAPEGSMVRIGLVVEGNEIGVRIEDNGPGMDREEIMRVTNRLYRGAASQGTVGSGLGLAIVREIVTAHNGRVDIRSEPGVGSVFTLFFPLDPPS